MIFTLPIFWEGELVGFSSSMAHWHDVGGTLRGATTDIYEEGLQIPIVKIYRQGVLNDELVEIIKTNVRFPDLAMGDFRAQIASIKTGERRFVQLLAALRARRGAGQHPADLPPQRRGGAAGGARRSRTGSTRPRASWTTTASASASTSRIQVGRRRGRPDDHRPDATVSRQVAGYFNSGATAGRSAAQVAFKCLTSPLLLPINDGSFAPLSIVLPPGRVVSRGEAGRGAHVDDDPDDGGRHDHPRHGAGDAATA